MMEWKNMLVVAGTNRNVGKTTLACKIIHQISQLQPVVAIKITPHFHADCSSCQLLYVEKGLQITKELSTTSHKDSSLMLAAGASEVFYVQATDEKLPIVINFLIQRIAENIPVVCESAAIRNFINPGKFILLSGNKIPLKNLDKIPLADAHLQNFYFNAIQFAYSSSGWQLKHQE
ncbi:MAG: hypothetical protein AB7E36_10685 [Salinivirgaceae bacterium]